MLDVSQTEHVNKTCLIYPLILRGKHMKTAASEKRLGRAQRAFETTFVLSELNEAKSPS